MQYVASFPQNPGGENSEIQNFDPQMFSFQVSSQGQRLTLVWQPATMEQAWPCLT